MMKLFSMLQNNLTVTTNIIYEVSNNHSVGNNIIGFLAQAKNAWIDFGASLVNYFRSYQFKELIFTLKTISFILCLILLAGIIYVFIKSSTLKKTVGQAKKSGIPKKKTHKQWAKIGKRFKSGIEANYKLAVLEADKFYDESLKIVGNEKEQMLSNLEELKKARRIKTRIIDDSEYVLNRENAINVLVAYKKALEELGIL